MSKEERAEKIAACNQQLFQRFEELEAKAAFVIGVQAKDDEVYIVVLQDADLRTKDAILILRDAIHQIEQHDIEKSLPKGSA